MCKAINVHAREWLLRPEIRAVVHLQLNVLNLAAWEAFKAVHVDLVVKVPHAIDDGVALHLLHVLRSDDHGIACARDKDVNFTHDGFQGCHLESLHASLQGANGGDLCDKHASTRADVLNRSTEPSETVNVLAASSPSPKTAKDRTPPIACKLCRLQEARKEFNRHSRTLVMDFRVQASLILQGLLKLRDGRGGRRAAS